MSAPLLTKSITSGVLSFVGDCIAQTIENRSRTSSDSVLPSSIDWKRACVFGSFGLLVFGPAAHGWYSILHRITHNTSLAKANALVRLSTTVAADQLLFSPLCIATAFTYMGIMWHGSSPAEVKTKISAELFSTLKVNWMLWTPCQILNFSLTPLAYRVLVVNVVGVVWNVFLAYTCST